MGYYIQCTVKSTDLAKIFADLSLLLCFSLFFKASNQYSAYVLSTTLRRDTSHVFVCAHVTEEEKKHVNW